MVKEFEYYKNLTELGVDKWKNVTGNVSPEEYKKLLVRCTKNLYNLQDMYKERECLIMGLGPSLLELNKNEYKDCLKMVCNGFNNVPDFFDDDFKPDFWCGANDWEVFKTPVNYCIENNIKMFATTPNSMQFEEMLNLLKEKDCLDNTFVWHWDSEILQKMVADKNNIDKCFSRPITIIIEMIAFALWLGCDPINITGMDLSYQDALKKTGSTHAGFSVEWIKDSVQSGAPTGEAPTDKKPTRSPLGEDKSRIINDLAYLCLVAKKNNIQINNLSSEANGLPYNLASILQRNNKNG
jgi:hypothetical protein